MKFRFEGELDTLFSWRLFCIKKHMGTIPGIWGYCPYLWNSGHMTHLKLYRVHVQNVTSWIRVLHILCHSANLKTDKAIKNLNSKAYFTAKIRSRSYSMSVANFICSGVNFVIFFCRWNHIGSLIWNMTYFQWNW